MSDTWVHLCTCFGARTVPIMWEAPETTTWANASRSMRRANIKATRQRVDRFACFGPNTLTESAMQLRPSEKLKVGARAKKEALIKGNWTEIKRLARRRSGKSRLSSQD